MITHTAGNGTERTVHLHLTRSRSMGPALAGLVLLILAAAPAQARPSVATPDPVATASPAAGSFYPLDPTRLVGGAASGRSVRPGQPLHVPVLGRPGLPMTGVSAVVLNVTVTATAAAPALVGLRPGGGTLATARPLTSVTTPARGTRTSLVTVPLDPAGALDLVTSAPATVMLDLVGLYAADDTIVAALGPSGGYQPSDPVRLLGPGAGSTSAGSTADGADPTPSAAPAVDVALGAPVAPNGSRSLGVDLGGAIAPHVTALLLRVSVSSSPSGGTVTVAPGGRDLVAAATTTPGSDPGAAPATATSTSTSPTTTPSLSLQTGVTASNLVVVPAVLDDEGLLRLTVTTDLPTASPVRLDLVGFYDDGGLGPDLRFRALPVGRVLDTRSDATTGPLGPSDRHDLRPGPDVVGDNTFGIVGSMTVLSAPARPTDVSVRRDDLDTSATAPGAVSVGAGDQATTPVQAEVGASGRLVLTTSTGPAQVVLDVVGSLEAFPAVSDPTVRGWVHAVPAWQVRALAR